MEKNNPLKDFFTKDLSLKILSLIVAIVAWFGVMNTIEPHETRSFNVPVKFENTRELISQGYIISNLNNFEDFTVEIGIEATRLNLDTFVRENAEKNSYAKIDLSNVAVYVDDEADFPQSIPVTLNPVLPANLNSLSYKITSYNPSVVSIEVDRISSIKKDTKVKILGNAADGYEITDTNISTETVTVSGPESKINEINNVYLNIEANNIEKDTTYNISPTVYDKSGNELSGFVFEPTHVNVDLIVQKHGTMEINQPKTQGKLPANFELASIDWSPKSITVIGPSDKIGQVSAIDIPAIDLSNIHGDTIITKDITSIVKQSGCTIKDQKNNQVSITIKLNLINSKDITINKSAVKVIGLPDTKNITLPDNITVAVAGAENINASALNPTIDVAGLSDGKHSVRLNLTPPENVAINSNIDIDVSISSKNDSAKIPAPAIIAPVDSNNQ
jgi:ybbR family protein